MGQILLLASLAAQMSAPLDTGTGGVLTTLHGRCVSSIMGSGPADSDLTKGAQTFQCDKAVLTFFMAQNRVLIQFVNSRARAGIVGFAGAVSTQDREVKVDRMFLNDGTKLAAEGGFCVIRGSGKNIRSITCAAKVQDATLSVGASITFIVPPRARAARSRP